MSVATVGLVLFGGCVGELFNFELAIFGTDDSFGGVSRVGKTFDMVVGNLKTSSLAGGEPAGTERSCQLGDTCHVELADVSLGKNNLVIKIGSKESLRHPMRSALSSDETTVSGFTKIVEFRSHFDVIFFKCLWTFSSLFLVSFRVFFAV